MTRDRCLAHLDKHTLDERMFRIGRRHTVETAKEIECRDDRPENAEEPDQHQKFSHTSLPCLKARSQDGNAIEPRGEWEHATARAGAGATSMPSNR